MPQIMCNVCGKESDPLTDAPMGGALGEQILAKVCAACWQDWLDQQARVINHYGLQLAYPEDRKRLIQYMKEFLKLETT